MKFHSHDWQSLNLNGSGMNYTSLLQGIQHNFRKLHLLTKATTHTIISNPKAIQKKVGPAPLKYQNQQYYVLTTYKILYFMD